MAQDIQTLYARQRDYTLGNPDGSLAIAYGRTAGLAVENGNAPEGNQFWESVAKLPASRPVMLPPVFPGPEQIVAACNAHPESFAAFADPAAFPAGGTPASNALGSLAFGLDYARRGREAIERGGDPQWIAHWAEQALVAAGYEKLAPALTTRIKQRTSERGVAPPNA